MNIPVSDAPSLEQPRLKLTNEERSALRMLITSDGWEILERAWKSYQAQLLAAYLNAERGEHAFCQGKVIGFIEATKLAETLSVPEETPVPRHDADKEFWRNKLY